ncbi:MAG TPA: DUF2203 domain-containing protein [Methylomirabilota bacterium]|nr:DUF2203 domain-containing protein [Methylomirabilota bacterium]
MSERYFTPQDVERLIPRLAAVMERVRAAHLAGVEAREAQDAEQRRIALAGGGVVDQAAWRARQETIERCTARVQAGLEEVHGLGGVTKDLGLGLVDFPHLRDGREVNLCWKLGEQHITHWHGLDEGYARRKPL